MQPLDAPLYQNLADVLERANGADWSLIARPSQLAPPGDWQIWLLLAGRGFGKTRTGAEWIRWRVERGLARRVALVAPTAADARDVMVEGESGILAISPSWNRPVYEPSRRRLEWPNGAIATTYSADEPERLRGPQHDAAWCDELGAWRYPEAWDQLQFGLRLGRDPRSVVTTTPKPIRVIRELLKREGADVVVTRGRTAENAPNLSPAFLATIVRRYEGTRLGRQELNAELLDDAPGALWQRTKIDELRVSKTPDFYRVVVAIDPAATSGEDADETGIVVAGIDAEGHGFVLEDLSGRFTPHEWAKRAIRAYHKHKADRIVAEVNNGGEMVEATIRAVDQNVSFKAVHASRGKAVRAEPIAALYEQGKCHHVGAFPQLEDQMCLFAADLDRSRGSSSPDRADALVWAFTELMVRDVAGAGMLEFYRREAEKVGSLADEDGLPPRPGRNWSFGPKREEPKRVTLRAPDEFNATLMLGSRKVVLGDDRTIEVSDEEAAALECTGWQRVKTAAAAVEDEPT